jgi:hypothetical protein
MHPSTENDAAVDAEASLWTLRSSLSYGHRLALAVIRITVILFSMTARKYQ